MNTIYTPDYGPFDDKFRIRAVSIAEVIGYRRAAAYVGCSEAAIRTWTKVYASGRINVEIERV